MALSRPLKQPQAVAFLAGDWDGAGPLDLSRLLGVEMGQLRRHTRVEDSTMETPGHPLFF